MFSHKIENDILCTYLSIGVLVLPNCTSQMMTEHVEKLWMVS